MDKQKQKILDNYIIKELIQTDALGISIYRAIHSVTGGQFILKKASVSIQLQEGLESQRVNQLSMNPASFLYNEIQKIKQINCHRILKCIQMIKTKRSIYLIYENYPEYRLSDYLSNFEPSLEIRIYFGKIICQTLQQIHRKCYVYLNLSPESIFVDKNTNDLKFKGFQYAVKMGTLQKRKIQYAGIFENNPFSAPELIQKGQVQYETDIYSIGKMLEFLNITHHQVNYNQIVKQCLDSTLSPNPSERPNISKIWSCLKIIGSKQKIQKDTMSNRIKLTVTRVNGRDFLNKTPQKPGLISPSKLNIPIQRRLIQEEETKLKKLMKIRNLILFLHDLANFCLTEKDKELFYLLLKKGAIIRANLLRQCKKMIGSPASNLANKVKRVIQILDEEQTSTLNMLTEIQEVFTQQSRIIDPKLKVQLSNRKQLQQSYLQQKIRQFLAKKIKQIKVFHTPADLEERAKLVNLCGMSEKLVYGSFEAFFDEVVDQNILDVNQQKYFEYLRKGSTREILDRIDRIIKKKI